MLFAAVALTGVLAAVGMQTLTGPVSTITRVTQRNVADTQLLMNAKILVNAAITGVSDGDLDGDGIIEPEVFTAPVGGETAPVGGGFLPTNLGLSLSDPWGTKYGYCVWDHGTTNSSAGRIDGDGTASASTQPVIAIIAAGPDKTFQTTCNAYSGTPIVISKAGGSDDIIFKYSYAEASANSNGLWSVNVSDAARAELKSSGGGSPSVTINRDTGIGDFLGLTTNVISAKTDETIALDGGLLLDVAGATADTCTAAEKGSLRLNTDRDDLELCDGAGGWVEVRTPPGGSAGHVQFNDGAGGFGGDANLVWNNSDKRLGVGGSPSANTLDVTGTFGASGNSTVGGTLGVTGATTLSNTLGVAGAATLSDTLSVSGNATFDTDTLFVDAAGDKVGIGNASPAHLLDITGAGGMGTLGSFMVGDAVLHVDDGAANLYVDGQAIISDAGLILGTTGAQGLQLVTGETQRILIAADGTVSIAGNTGIGGAATLSGTLSVAGVANFDSGTLYVDVPDRRVGIGTTDPLTKLDVAGGVKIGADTLCSIAKAGMVAWNSGELQLCGADGYWTSLAAVENLDDIGDVEVLSPNANEVLAWDGVKWVAKNIAMLGPATVNVAGNDGSVQFRDGNDLGADPDYFHWDKTNHRLGIGTSAPSTALVVSGNAAPLPDHTFNNGNSTPLLQIGGADETHTAVTVDSFGGSGASSGINFRAAGGTAAAPTAIGNNKQLGAIRAFGYGATAYSSGTRAAITMRSAEAWTDTAQGTDIRFSTTLAGSTTIAERMRIAGDGRVGIGTATPQSLLHVAGGIQLGDDTATCPGASNVKLGTLRFNGGNLQVCKSSGWSGVSSGGSGGSTTLGGWPDAIVCNTSDGRPYVLWNQGSYDATRTYYSTHRSAATLTWLIYNDAGGTYSTHTNLPTLDCVTNSWAISDLYAQGRAFNLAGGDTLAGLSCASGEIAKWNGLAWECAADGGGSGSTTLAGLTDVSTTGIASGKALVYDGTKWTPQTVAGGSPSSSPGFFAHANNTNITVTADQFTKLNWTHELYDATNEFDLTNDRFQPSVAGRYIIALQAYMSTCGAGSTMEIRKNGGTTIAYTPILHTGGSRGGGSTVVDMNGTTDYLEAFAYCVGATTINGGAAQTSFSGALLGGGSSQWTDVTGGINYAGGNVGVGVATPADKIDVAGSGANGTGVQITATGTAGTHQETPFVRIKNTNRTWLVRADGTDGNKFQVQDATANAQRLSIDSNGNVGIGTANPSTPLEVVGTVKAASGLVWSANGSTTTSRSLLLENFNDTANANGVDIGVKLGGTEFQGLSWVQETAWTSGSAAPAKDVMLQLGVLNDNTAENRLYVRASGDVGIGVVSPQSKLHVAGGIQLGNDTATCPGASNEKLGTLKYASNTLSVCNTTGWAALSAGGGGGGGSSDPYTVLLLHATGADGSTTFTDSATGKAVAASGSAQIDTAQFRFDGSSALFDGTDDYLAIGTSPDFNFGTGDFTVDLWVRFNVVSGQPIYEQGAYNNSGFLIRINESGSNQLSTYLGGSLRQASFTWATNTWYHIAVARQGTTLGYWVNGNSIGTFSGVSASVTDDGLGVQIGNNLSGATASDLNGWVDELRVSKGVARWLPGNGFTPPSVPYTNANGGGSSSQWADVTGGINYMAGNVGIGVTSPANLLDMAGSGGSGTGVQIAATGTAGTHEETPFVRLKNTNRTWLMRVDGTDGNKFQIRDATANAQRLTIDASGRVGIGTVAPSELLEVAGTVASIELSPSNTTGVNGLIRFKNSTDVGRGGLFYNEDSDTLNLMRSIGASAVNGLSLISTGNVGIGTTTPQSLLHVAGGIQLGDDTATCPGASNVKVGTLRFNAGNLEVCKTTGWLAVGGAISTLDDVGDVSASSASSGQVLGWNGSAWVPFNVSLAETQIPQGQGTPIGDMTAGGGLAAAFDGNTGQSSTSGARNPPDGEMAYIGKDYGAGNAKSVTGFKAWGTTDGGFLQNQDGSVTLTLYGSNTAPSNDTDGTSLGSATVTDSSGLLVTKSNTGNGNAYRYVWITVSPALSPPQSNWLAEVQFFEGGVSAEALWQASGSNVYRTGGNVGIGTASPASRLHVAGGIQLGDDTATCPGAASIKLGTLRYNSSNLQICQSSGWVTVGSGGGAGGTMVFGWPDAIVCNISNPANFGNAIFYLSWAPSANDTFTHYRANVEAGTHYGIRFNSSTGAYVGLSNLTTTDCNNKSIAILYSEGKAFNFAGGGGASSQWTTAGSDIYYNTGKVGIGTATPSLIGSNGLEIKGDYPGLRLNATGGGGYTYELLSTYSGSDNRFMVYDASNSQARLTISEGGNVGIGTTSPRGALEVATGYSSSITTPTGFAMSGGGPSPDKGQIFWGDNSGWKLNFGTSVSGTFTPRVTFMDTGNVGIGTTNPGSSKLHIAGSAPVMRLQDTSTSGGAARAYIEFTRSDGAVTGGVGDSGGANNIELWAAANVTVYSGSNTCTYSGGASWSCSSDDRLKKDIQTIPSALDTLLRVQGVSYRWIDPKKGDGKHFGVIAQDVEKVYPELVSVDEKGFRTVDYSGFIAPLIEAVKELKADNDNLRAELKATNDDQAAAIEELRREIDALKVAK